MKIQIIQSDIDEKEKSREKVVSGMGLVLRRVKHLENDVRLTVLMKDLGKILVAAKGGQKLSFKLKGLLEPLSESDFQLYIPHQGVHSRLIGGRLSDSHYALRLQYRAFELACKSCEIVNSVLPFRAPSEDAYLLLSQCLKNLPQSETPEWEWVHFTVSLLARLGHGDFSDDVIRLFPFPEQQEIRHFLLETTGDRLSPVRYSEPALWRAMGLVNANLGHILPHRLKSDVLNQNGQ